MSVTCTALPALLSINIRGSCCYKSFDQGCPYYYLILSCALLPCLVMSNAGGVKAPLVGGRRKRLSHRYTHRPRSKVINEQNLNIMATSHSLLIAAFVGLFLIVFPSVLAYPSPPSSRPLWVVSRQTQQPYFPDTPASCPICAQGYPSISSCAQASTVLANFTSVCNRFVAPPLNLIGQITVQIAGHFQPGRVHRCNQVLLHRHLPIRLPAMCRLVRLFTGPSQVGSRCSNAASIWGHSFERTNQTAVLDTPDLPSLVDSIREVCSFASSILGNASNSDGETTPTVTSASATTAAAAATGGSSSGARPTWDRFGASLSSLCTGAAAAATALIVFFSGASLL